MSDEMLEQFRKYQETSFAGVVIHENGVIRQVNDVFERISGYSPSELVGMDCLRLIAPQSRDFAGKKIFSDSYVIHGLMGMKKSGAAIPLKIQGKTLAANGKVLKVMEWYPLEDDSRPMETLWNTADTARFVIENSHEAIGQLDTNFNITYANQAFEAIGHGFTREELIGKNFLDFVAPESVVQMSQVKQMRSRAEEAGIKTGSVRYEIQTKRKDGTLFWVEATVGPLRDQTGLIVGYNGIIRDISKTKHDDEERERMEKELEKTQKMANVGQISGGVAHDLNNVLAGILGYSELMMLECSADEVLSHHLKNILSSADRAASIVQDLGILARHEGWPRKATGLNDIVTGCLQRRDYQKMKKHYPGIEIRTHLGTGLPRIEAVVPQLEKTILNLISFCLESVARQKDGCVSIETRTLYLGCPNAEEAMLSEGEYVVLTVRDTGECISCHDMQSLFEPFYTKKVMKRGTTGLELVVVRETVDNHCGFIDALSEPGTGTVFTLYLPVLRAKTDMNAARLRLHS